MYQFLCLLSGVLLACVVTTNGSLTGYYGAYVGAVMIHIVGTVVSFAVLKASGQKSKPDEKLPLWMYAGGTIGILTTVFQGIAFGQLGTTAVMALSLFGQTVTSLLVDSFGFFGMEKRSVQKGTILGLLISMGGIGYMLMGAGDMGVYAMLMSIASGVSGVTSRLANAQLSARTSAIGGSFTNHWTGLIGSVLLMFVAEPDIMGYLQVTGVPAWVYIGGALGVAMVMLWNIAGLKVPAFQLTMLSFAGQVFTGLVLDQLIGNGFSQEIFVGGAFVIVGVAMNMLAECKSKE